MELKDTYQIAKILSKHFIGSLTEIEQVELDNWLNASENNKILFNKFSSKDFFEEKRLAESSANSEAAMREFMERKYHAANQKNFFARYFKYAAAAILLIAGTLIFYNNQKQDKTPHYFSTLKENVIPGSKKAILTLANGKKVFLNNKVVNNIHEQNISIKSTDSSIQYQASDKVSSLIYNTLETPKKSEFMITLDDKTKVWLNSGSKIRFPVAFAANERRIELSGEAYFEVSKDAKKPFIIDIGNNSIQVLGTSFNVNAYKGDPDIYTTLVEGSVRMTTPSQSLDLKPNEQGIINLKLQHMTKNPVDVNLYTSWKNGRFIFDDQSLGEIMNSISRWYGINIVFESEAARQFKFSFNLKRYDSLNEIMDMLGMTKQITFKKEGSTIYIKK